jgi:hypothetical protein
VKLAFSYLSLAQKTFWHKSLQTLFLLPVQEKFKRLLLECEDDPWCNGSTTDFGSVS